MQFVAEVKSGGFKTKMVKEGPPVIVREIKLIVDSNAYCLDEISKMVNQPVRVEFQKVQLSFEAEPSSPQPKPEELPLKAKPKRVRRKSELKH